LVPAAVSIPTFLPEKHMGVFARIRDLLTGQPRVDVKKRFELKNRVGQGSMSKVYRAYDREHERTVALKLLDMRKTADLEARFDGRERPPEWEVSLRLRHPNVVETFEHGLSTEGERFMVMEFVEGGGLSFLIDTKAPQLEGRRLDLLKQLARGVEYLHRQGLIHRDLCPRNVLVSETGQVKIIDFGLAVPNTPEFRRPGNRTGTANYMAPELIRRQPTDQRIDVFSYSVTAYELVTGTLPWESTESLQAAMQHINEPPTDLGERQPDLDQKLAGIIMKGIARDPGERWPNMTALREALETVPKQSC
jgi:serine/threonine protein kinase